MSELDIPFNILKQNLPSQHLSIRDLLAFKLPQASSPAGLLAQNTYLSKQNPDASTEDIQTLLSTQVPSISMIQDLVDCFRANCPSTAKSLAYAQTDSADIKHFPLWFVTYWFEVNHVITQRQHWLLANQCLQKLCRGEEQTKELVNAVYQVLSWLPWSGSIQGFTEKEDVMHLHKYATMGWLSTVHENQMLDLLQHDIIRYNTSSTEIIQPTYFVPSLRRAFSQAQKKFSKDPLRLAGQLLASGDKKYLGTIVNHQNTHWIAVVLDFSTHTIWHGDSLGWAMDSELKTVLEWWIWQYTSVPFTHRSLPITHQADSFSCGLFAWNALSHFFLPKHHHLIHPSDATSERLRILLRVCAHHHKEVSRFIAGSRSFTYFAAVSRRCRERISVLSPPSTTN